MPLCMAKEQPVLNLMPTPGPVILQLSNPLPDSGARGGPIQSWVEKKKFKPSPCLTEFALGLQKQREGALCLGAGCPKRTSRGPAHTGAVTISPLLPTCQATLPPVRSTGRAKGKEGPDTILPHFRSQCQNVRRRGENFLCSTILNQQ